MFCLLLASSVLAAPTNLLIFGQAGSSTNSLPLAAMLQKKAAIRPLFSKMASVKPGDWLASYEESGQTFDEYIQSKPPRPAGKRTRLYILPIGDFTDKQMSIVKLTAEFMAGYFNLVTVVQDKLPLSVIPKAAQRTHPKWGDKQVLTGFVLEKILKPRLPADAAACIAFTASDLWPGEGWNFVFGQASLQDRVGVWSIYRNGNAEGAPEEFRTCLLRTMQTATHETGHMFGIEHCIAYECNMCGCNSREEADRRPIASCPECVAKIWWATRADPLARYEKLVLFCKQQELQPQEEIYRRLAARCR